MISMKRLHSDDRSQSNVSPPKRQKTRRYNLFDLPQNVLEQILLLIDISSLGKLGLVSKNIRDLV